MVHCLDDQALAYLCPADRKPPLVGFDMDSIVLTYPRNGYWEVVEDPAGCKTSDLQGQTTNWTNKYKQGPEPRGISVQDA
jgi:hypothetical protein